MERSKTTQLPIWPGQAYWGGYWFDGTITINTDDKDGFGIKLFCFFYLLDLAYVLSATFSMESVQVAENQYQYSASIFTITLIIQIECSVIHKVFMQRPNLFTYKSVIPLVFHYAAPRDLVFSLRVLPCHWWMLFLTDRENIESMVQSS